LELFDRRFAGYGTGAGGIKCRSLGRTNEEPVSRSRWLVLNPFVSLLLAGSTFGQLRGKQRLQGTSGTTAGDASSLASNSTWTYTNSPALASSAAVPANGAIAASFDGVQIMKWVEIR
jgi:hypothetical protein